MKLTEQEIQTLKRACEFLNHGTPIHPGSEVAMELEAMTQRVTGAWGWTCEACNEPHDHIPQVCNYCGTKPETK